MAILKVSLSGPLGLTSQTCWLEVQSKNQTTCIVMGLGSLSHLPGKGAITTFCPYPSYHHEGSLFSLPVHRHNPDRTQRGQDTTQTDTTWTGHNPDRTQPGQDTTKTGHNQDTDTTRTQTQARQDTTQTQTLHWINPDKIFFLTIWV